MIRRLWIPLVVLGILLATGVMASTGVASDQDVLAAFKAANYGYSLGGQLATPADVNAAIAKLQATVPSTPDGQELKDLAIRKLVDDRDCFLAINAMAMAIEAKQIADPAYIASPAHVADLNALFQLRNSCMAQEAAFPQARLGALLAEIGAEPATPSTPGSGGPTIGPLAPGSTGVACAGKNAFGVDPEHRLAFRILAAQAAEVGLKGYQVFKALDLYEQVLKLLHLDTPEADSALKAAAVPQAGLSALENRTEAAGLRAARAAAGANAARAALAKSSRRINQLVQQANRTSLNAAETAELTELKAHQQALTVAATSATADVAAAKRVATSLERASATRLDELGERILKTAGKGAGTVLHGLSRFLDGLEYAQGAAAAGTLTAAGVALTTAKLAEAPKGCNNDAFVSTGFARWRAGKPPVSTSG
jgi:hypothetical protein